jgi:CHAT domain-containing protein
MVAVLAAAMPLGFVPATPAIAQGTPVLLRDSFPIGSGEGILCQVQDRSVGNPARQTMFDRRWAVVCRDSARAVASVYAFQGRPADPSALIAPLRRESIDCTGETAAAVPGIAGLTRRQCAVSGTKLGWSVFDLQRGGTTYSAEGFSAYDSATLLALRSVADNAVAPGKIDVATTSVGDPVAFARVQAETLEPKQALAEGYRRNLGGDYAEAAAYFETLQQRLSAPGEDTGINPAEFLVNRALQKSNLGQFAEADRLFAQAQGKTLGDPVAERLQRNYEAIHLLNEGDPTGAIARLNKPVTAQPVGVAGAQHGLEISGPIASRLNGDGNGGLLGFVDEFKLTPQERAEIIDAQALQLNGTALRLLGRDAEARKMLLDSYDKAAAVRDGRVTSITRLRAQVLSELAAISEGQGDAGAAENYLRNAVQVLEVRYPEQRAVSGARARLAAFLLRRGRDADALALYREVIAQSVGKRDAIVGFANQLAPYFRFAAPKVESDPAFADDFFKATQVLIRPGVAETQAILARELSANSDEAARLFRQSTDLARDIERDRIRYQILGQSSTADAAAQRSDLISRIGLLEEQQQHTQAALAAYPQYRVVAPSSLSLADFRAELKPGEAYARMAQVGGDVFMFYADRDIAKAWRIPASESDLDYEVDMLRASISTEEGGQNVTYPYEIARARALYQQLFGPVADRLPQVHHLVFEPDGAMLRLPVNILVADDASVANYDNRVKAGGDPFDFTGVNWLGRATDVSTAVSAQAFVDARRAPRSKAAREYLGLGSNQPVGKDPAPAIKVHLYSGSDPCGWSVATWNHPIDKAELISAEQTIGAANSQLLTGAQFTDESIKAKPDLNQYRILHFATHGLVTPPAPPCPARPALLTSFGDAKSDGLLSFDEIFDLDIDADLVILSACDTAGGASIEATREAGVGSGGGTALDGLVRSFIGAGGRAVLASHWPAPDQYHATERLMDQMFREGRTKDLGEALRASETRLMDDPATSHPYYWGGFAIIGDAARPLLSQDTTVASGANGGVGAKLEH